MPSIFAFYVCAFVLHLVGESRCYRVDVSAPGLRRDVVRIPHNQVNPNTETDYAKNDQYFKGRIGKGPYMMNRIGDGPVVQDTSYERRRNERLLPNWNQADDKELDMTLLETTRSALRSPRSESYLEALQEDFNLLLQKMEVDKTRMTTVPTSTYATKVLNVIDETEVRNALREDPLVQRILAQAQAKRRAFFKQMEENEMMAYDSYHRRYPTYT